MRVHIIDKNRQIAIFENLAMPIEDRYQLMVSAKSAIHFPIIVNYSERSKQVEFNFTPPHYQSLLDKGNK